MYALRNIDVDPVCALGPNEFTLTYTPASSNTLYWFWLRIIFQRFGEDHPYVVIFQHVEFIRSTNNIGSLADVSLEADNYEISFRTSYFKQYVSHSVH